jgi:iron complex transport system permease protein
MVILGRGSRVASRSARNPRRSRSGADATTPPAVPAGRSARLGAGWLAAGLGAVLVAALAGLAIGPVALDPVGVAAELLNLIPGVHVHSGLTPQEAAIVIQLRLPRVVLGLLVGAMLALAGGCYQGVFRNPLADPYLLGAAAGAGLGATVAVAVGVSTGVSGGARASGLVPVLAFAGAITGVVLSYGLGALGSRVRTTTTLILAGVAVTSFLTAMQTYVLQRNVETIREVYSFILGSLATSGWDEVRLLAPYAAVAAVVVLLHHRELDVLSVGDEEASSLGLHPQRSRYVLVAAASLGTAAAVSVSGLIGFVGIIVPHAVRLLAGTSYRSILPLSALFGAAFLALCDLAARTVQAPTEVPIGVITAFIGAPFFVFVLRTAKRVGI